MVILGLFIVIYRHLGASKWRTMFINRISAFTDVLRIGTAH